MSERCLPSVVVVFCLLVVAESDKLNVDETRNKCRDENKLLERSTDEYNKEGGNQRPGLMTEDGDITSISPPGTKYNVSPCKDVKGADSCEKALNLHNCMWKLVEKEERDEAK